jgi:hypothetical protein
VRRLGVELVRVWPKNPLTRPAPAGENAGGGPPSPSWGRGEAHYCSTPGRYQRFRNRRDECTWHFSGGRYLR